MSAIFDKKQSLWLLNSVNGDLLNEQEEALIATEFDTQTDYEIQDIKKKIQQEKFLRKVCFMKLVSSVPEIFLSYFLFSKEVHEKKIRTIKLYYKFLFKKINFKTFKRDISEEMRGGGLL